MIRAATPGDFPAIEDMLRDFHAAAGVPLDPGQYSSRYFRARVQDLIESERGFAHVLDLGGLHGVLLAAASPSPFLPVLTTSEIMWWIAPESRGGWAGAMLDAYEAWAGRIGARIVGLAGFDARVGTLYRRRGYVRVETNYMRVS